MSFELPTTESDTQHEITRYLASRGYTVTDYLKGFCADASGNRVFRIGRLLKNNPALAKSFEHDKTRTGGELMVVISRHPYDIARMSTGRAWNSCMDKNSGTNNYHYVAHDIAEGTVISYLVRKSDPNITNPLARQLLKPYRNANAEVVLLPQQVYGIKSMAFEITNASICATMLNVGKFGEYIMPEVLFMQTASAGTVLLTPTAT